MSTPDLSLLDDNALRAVLLTVDGRGREVKVAALDQLIRRSEARGYHEGIDAERAEPTPPGWPETAREYRAPLSEDDARIIADWHERHAADIWRARLRTITNCGSEEVQVCTCSRTDVCPLERSSAENRCTEDELEAYGRQKGWLT